MRPGANTLKPQAEAVLRFWLADALESGWPGQDMHARWFGGGAALDQEVETRFGSLVREAVADGLGDWEADPKELLALILLLDQFTRNVFRGQALAFSGDLRARRLAIAMLAQGSDLLLPWAGRAFLLMPLVHAEDAPLQQQALERLRQLLAEVPVALHAAVQGFLRSAEQHHAIINRFGRYPHRNALLRRADTAQERVYLQDGPRFGQ